MKYTVPDCDNIGRDNQCRLPRHSHYVECQDCIDCKVKLVIEGKDHYIIEPYEEEKDFVL